MNLRLAALCALLILDIAIAVVRVVASSWKGADVTPITVAFTLAVTTTLTALVGILHGNGSFDNKGGGHG